MDISDLVSNNYIIASPSQKIVSLREVLLSGKPVVVKEQDVFLGMVSPRDLLKPYVRVLDVLAEQPLVKSSDDALDSLLYMLEYGHDYLPVKNNKGFEGVISAKELAKKVVLVYKGENNLELKKELALKNKFLSIIGHDIRNMFNQVLGSLELLGKRLQHVTDDKNMAILKLARRSAQQVNSAFEAMLLWARLGTGQLPFNPELLSLNDQYSKIVAQFQLAGDVKSITIKNKLTEEVSIYADRNMLGCILLNLVYNAIKFTPQGGEIWMDAKASEDKTEIVVVDSGLGMTLHQKNLLFTEGQATAGTMNETGAGIGLIICKEFVEKHLGKIEIESEPAKGTRVIISIPNSYSVLA